MNLLDYFDRAYVINLRERADRRRETERELRRPDLGLRPDQVADRVHFFPAVKPEEAGPFTSVGMKGCSLSHLSVLRDALQRGLSRVLILEDDAEFVGELLGRASSILAELAQRPWGVVQFGYMGGPASSRREDPRLVEFSGEVLGAHCYGVSRMAIDRLVAHFETQLKGTPGDALRGPMSPDGTLNVFRWLNPDLPRLLVVPSLVRQRRSKSDISPRALDRIPVVRSLVGVGRAFLNGWAR